MPCVCDWDHIIRHVTYPPAGLSLSQMESILNGAVCQSSSWSSSRSSSSSSSSRDPYPHRRHRQHHHHHNHYRRHCRHRQHHLKSLRSGAPPLITSWEAFHNPITPITHSHLLSFCIIVSARYRASIFCHLSLSITASMYQIWYQWYCLIGTVAHQYWCRMGY